MRRKTQGCGWAPELGRQPRDADTAAPKKLYRFHLNGEIGGYGNIRVKGDNDPGPDHLPVIGGSDDFNGVVGKLTWEGGKAHFDLVR
jgi:hypothetical protein